MKIRTYVTRDTESLLELWNSAHPSTPLTMERMARLLFLDCNFSPADLLVAVGDDGRELLGMSYCPHRYFAVGKDGDIEENKGFITLFAVACDSFDDVGKVLLSVSEEHHRRGGRSIISTAYSPLYLTQGFESGEENYIRLFESSGYSRSSSYKRSADLASFSLPGSYVGARRRLESEGIVFGPLRYEYLQEFLDPGSEFSSPGWSWEFRTRLSADFDLEKARTAVCGGHVIGGCIFGDPNSDEGRFGPLGVSPAFRGRGIGGVLFADCLETMKRRGIKRAWAQWTPGEGPAHALYEKAGFAIEACIVSFRKELK